jgi:hypothetical protein
MVLTITERVIKTIDLSEFSDEDRIKITLEDDRVIFLKNDPRYERNEAVIDKEMSDQTILEELYSSILTNQRNKSDIPFEQHSFLGIRWRTYDPAGSLEKYRTLSRLEVRINKFWHDTDDLAVGSFLMILPTLPNKGGSGRTIHPAIKSVEFLQV